MRMREEIHVNFLTQCLADSWPNYLSNDRQDVLKCRSGLGMQVGLSTTLVGNILEHEPGR